MGILHGNIPRDCPPPLWGMWGVGCQHGGTLPCPLGSCGAGRAVVATWGSPDAKQLGGIFLSP